MTHDDPQVLASMVRLRGNADFERFMTGYLGALLAETMQLCVDSDNPARHQGAAQIIQEIQTDVAEAEEAFRGVTNKAEVPLD